MLPKPNNVLFVAHISILFFIFLISCNNHAGFAQNAQQKTGETASPAAPDASISQICRDKKKPYPLNNSHLIVDKSKKTITLYNGNVLIKTYPVAFGTNPIGPKEEQGDGRTPEGEYYLVKYNSPAFGRCFYIAYPNLADASRGLKSRLISKGQFDAISDAVRHKSIPPSGTRLGGQILLHGTKDRSTGNLTSSDWTLGCVAMENAHVLELLAAIPDNARPQITIIPGKKEGK